MDTKNVGQTRLLENIILALNAKLLSPTSIVQDFPDPLALYSLYSVITQKQPCNKVPDIYFRPFKGRDRLEEDDIWGDHMYWIRILSEFLGERLVYSNSNHRGKLTDFGEYMYPALMECFLRLYEQNEILENLKVAWQAKCEKSCF